MKKKLMICFAGILCCVFFIVQFRALGSTQPFQKNSPFETVSQAVMDQAGSLYVIADSKLSLIKMDSNGKVIYELDSTLKQDRQNTYMYNDLAVDEHGAAYVIVSVLDEFGLKVVREHILKISADGKSRQMLYSDNIPETESYMRVGKLQKLHVEQNQLYFYKKQPSTRSVVLMSIDLVNDGLLKAPTEFHSVSMPPNQYLKEVIGIPSSQIFFTTKQGNLFNKENDATLQLYPEQNVVTTHFPVELSLYENEVYYIDNQEESIYSINKQQGTKPQLRLNVAELAQSIESKIEWSGLIDYTISPNGQFVLTSEELIVLSDASGNVAQVLEGYHYSWWHVIKQLLYVLLLLITIGLIGLFIRMIYTDVMNRKISLVAKQLLIVIPVIAVCMVWLIQSINASVAQQLREQTVKQLSILATNGQYLIDGDLLEELNSPADYRSSTFIELKNRLNGLFTTSGDNRGGLYNTIYRYVDGELYILIDDDDGVTMYEPFGTNESNLQVLEKGEIVVGEWKDATGSWVYALGPIYNHNDEIVGIYETGQAIVALDMKIAELRSQVIQIVCWIGIVLALVIALMTFYFLSSIGKLRKTVNLIASGEWNVKVDIHTKDEVEELGERFNMMTSAIKTYVSEVTKLNSAYVRFVPQQFLKLLGYEKMTEIQLGDQQNRYMTILVCHVRNFDELSRDMTTDENFTFINQFLNQFGPIIRENNGFISRYLGPGMLTMFPRKTSNALDAARHIRSQLLRYNQDREARGLVPIDIGISIHSGEVMLGIIGEEQRIEGSVISNHVNLAIDLERLSQTLGVSVLVTAQVFEGITPLERENIRYLGEIELTTQKHSIQLYDWFETDHSILKQQKTKDKARFEAAVESFSRGKYHDAREGFVQIMKANRNDLIAKYYFFKCDEYLYSELGEKGSRLKF